MGKIEYAFVSEYGECFVGSLEEVQEWMHNTSTQLSNLRVYRLGDEVKLTLTVEGE